MAAEADYVFLAKVHLTLAGIYERLGVPELRRHHAAMCRQMMQMANKVRRNEQ